MDQRRIGILKFMPLFLPVRWGGTRLATFKKNARVPNGAIGESWEISALPGMETVVADGPYAGYTLSRLLVEYGPQLMGQRLYSRFGNFFPLLIKFLDTDDDISVQVHPDDAVALGGRGKNELWYIISAERGSYLYSGFNRPMSPDRLTAAMSSNKLIDMLAKHFPEAGDVFYIPAGRIHSLGAGNLLLEVQQTSSQTYRLYDYNRRDLDGTPRKLHVDDAMRVLDYSQTDFGLARPQMLTDCESRVKNTPFFNVSSVRVMDSVTIDTAATDSPRILVAIAGAGTVTDDAGNTADIDRGQTLLVPAETRSIEIRATATPLKIIIVYIGQ